MMSFNQIYTFVSVVSDKFSAKVNLENRLPTATKRLRCTNECLATCFGSLSKQFKDLHNHVYKWQTILNVVWRQTMVIRVVPPVITNAPIVDLSFGDDQLNTEVGTIQSFI